MELKLSRIDNVVAASRCVLIVPFMELKQLYEQFGSELFSSLNRTFYGIETSNELLLDVLIDVS